MMHLLMILRGCILLKNPLPNEVFSHVHVSSCEEEDGNRQCERINTLFHIEKHIWDINCLNVDGDVIYDTDSESPRYGFLELVSLGQLIMLEVCKPFFIFDEQPYFPIDRVDLAQHKWVFHGNDDA
jgi:hypothetical protein